jgi:hypothetical protein
VNRPDGTADGLVDILLELELEHSTIGSGHSNDKAILRRIPTRRRPPRSLNRHHYSILVSKVKSLQRTQEELNPVLCWNQRVQDQRRLPSAAPSSLVSRQSCGTSWFLRLEGGDR